MAFKNISTGVELERVPAAVTKPTLVTCRVPRTLNVGECHVTVALDAEEEFQSLPLKFTVYNKPRFEKVVPSIDQHEAAANYVYIEHQIDQFI